MLSEKYVDGPWSAADVGELSYFAYNAGLCELEPLACQRSRHRSGHAARLQRMRATIQGIVVTQG